jgi:gamma-glutamyltranspeptidase/glutathione hydrolase
MRGFQRVTLLFELLLISICTLTISFRADARVEEGSHMMMAGPSKQAIIAGEQVSEMGGNVVDVAVAMGLTLSVTSPYYAALGGGGFALIRQESDVEVLDFREMAPAATHPKFYVEREKGASTLGGNAVGVPGFPAGLWAMHKKYGKLPWKKLFSHALRLANKGWRVSGEWASHTKNQKDNFFEGGKKHFLKKKMVPYRPGEKLYQKGLGRALRIIRGKGPKPFYKGDIAKDIIASIQKAGGVMTLKDLENYKVRWLKPLTTSFMNHKVYLMPPPSSGGYVIQTMLNLVEALEMKKYPMYSIDEFHLLGEIMSRAFRGRSLLGDPDFHKNPLEELTSKKHLAELADSISRHRTKKLKPMTLKILKESNETTHYSVLDAKGNAVALTVTLNGRYGSRVVSHKYGIALNNEMDDFTTRPGEPNMFGLIQGQGNLVEPGKRPLSSMSPTLVEKDGKIVMSLGAPGGPRIINGVFQAIYRTMVSGLDLDSAIQAPRVHHQFLPHELFIDDKRFPPAVKKGLERKGHKLNESWMARVYGVRMNSEGNLEAAYDLRGEGAAGGY